MRKPTKKLAVHRETIRALAKAELVHAAGGEVPANASGGKNCVAIADVSAQPPPG